MEDIRYTIAIPDDAATLATYRIMFLTELLGPQDEKVAAILHTNLERYFRDAIRSNAYTGILAKAGNEVVATGGMVFREQPGSFKNPSGRTAYILNMYTVPAFRRNGISTKVLNKLLDIARQNGITSFELHATSDGEPVYQKCGFQRHNEPTYRKHEFDPSTL